MDYILNLKQWFSWHFVRFSNKTIGNQQNPFLYKNVYFFKSNIFIVSLIKSYQMQLVIYKINSQIWDLY